MKPISVGMGFSDTGDAEAAAKEAEEMAGKNCEICNGICIFQL